jgi:ferredoxin
MKPTTPNEKIMTPDDVVQRGQCMGCGFCTVKLHSGQSAGRMEFDPQRGHHVPRFAGPAPAEFICPGAAMDLPALAQAMAYSWAVLVH